MKTNTSLALVFVSSLCLLSLNLVADNTAIGCDGTSNESGALSERYSDKVIDRPSVMPVGIINFDTNVKSEKFDAYNLNVASQFGIVSRVQGELNYDLDYRKAQGKPGLTAEHVISLGTKYNYLSIPHVSFSASASVPFHVRNGEIVKDMTIGLPVVFYNDVMAGCLLSNLLNLQMRPNVETTFNFPFWYGVQVYGNLWAMAESSFGKIAMKNPNNQAKWETLGFWKELPASLSLTYVINHYVDVGGNFGFGDTFKAKDTMMFGLSFSLRGGKLFG